MVKKILNYLFILSFITVLSATEASAQSRSLNDGSTPPGIEPGSPAGSFILSDFDTINPYSGNLNFRLPLVNTGGRGMSGYTVLLPINYRWTVWHAFDRPNQFYRHYPQSYSRSSSIRPGYTPGGFEIRRVQEGSSCTSDEPMVFSALTRVVFSSSDGTEYELIDALNGGSPRTAYCGVSPQASRGRVWHTYDGSFITFVADAEIRDLDGTIKLAGQLLFPDGTKYRIDNNNVSRIQDRNGNVTTFTYNGGTLTKVTDSIGKEITFTYDVQDMGQYGLHDQITYIGFGGQPRTIRISYKNLSDILRSDYTIQTINTLFGLTDMGSTVNNSKLVSAVWLPNDQNYKFYYNSYSELARVELPTGGAFEYDWGTSLFGGSANGIVTVRTATSSTLEFFPEIYRRVLAKRLYLNGETGNAFVLKTTFSQTQGQGTLTSSTTIEQRDAGNNLLGQTKHFFHHNPIPYESNDVFFIPKWDEGREYQTETFDIVGGMPILKKGVNQTWQQGVGSGYGVGNARMIESVTTLVDTNQVAKTSSLFPATGEAGFDQFNNQTDVYEYDYGTGAPGAFLRRSHTDYVSDTNYTSHTGSHLRGLPTSKLGIIGY